jgi:hypothetical protein
MGLIFSNSIHNIDHEKMDFHNNIIGHGILGKVIEVLGPNKFIIIIVHKKKTKKYLCKGYGYKSTDDADSNRIISQINMMLNTVDSVVDIVSYGIDENGYLLVELNNVLFDNSINNTIRFERGIEHEVNYDHFNKVL